MKTLVIIHFALLFIARNISIAQSVDFYNYHPISPSFEVENGKKFEGRTLLSSVEKGRVLLSFKELFNDSIKTYINGKLLRSDFVKTDSLELGLSNVAFQVSVEAKQRTTVVFSLPNSKRYIKFRISRKYKLIKIFKRNDEWTLVKTNYVPVYY